MNEGLEIKIIQELNVALNSLKRMDEVHANLVNNKKELENELKRMANRAGFIIDMKTYTLLRPEDAEF
jgi:hypothetical protein